MKVSIENLEFDTIIGILPFEREIKQRVIVNLDFQYDFKNGNFINYAEVASLVKKNDKEKYLLIEDALLDLKQKLHSKYQLTNLQIQITKPDILKECTVSVSL